MTLHPDELPLDPGDTLADPERHARLARPVHEDERAERRADDALSDFGSAALARRWARDDD